MGRKQPYCCYMIQVRNERVSRKHLYETTAPQERERNTSNSKLVRQEQVRNNDQSQRTILSLVQKPARCHSLSCHVG